MRDGVLQEAPKVKTYLNEEGVATFEFTILSPFDSLSYQFVVLDPKEKISSERYYIERACSLSETRKLSPQSQTKIDGMSLSASRLDEDIAVLERVSTLLSELEDEIKIK